MKYTFHAYGHPNILGSHKTTIEFTKDPELSLKGDCLVGVKADFESESLKKFAKNSKNNKISITISNNKVHETISAEINPDFDDDMELVIRKTDFISKRTFAVKANKAAFELDRKLIGFLKEKRNKIAVIIENK